MEEYSFNKGDKVVWLGLNRDQTPKDNDYGVVTSDEGGEHVYVLYNGEHNESISERGGVVPVSSINRLDVGEIFEISKMDGVSLERAALKLGEEVGELSAALLVFTDSPNKSKSADGNVLEEGTDVVMCALDVLQKAGYTVEDVNQMIAKKCPKWKAKFCK